MGRLIGREWHLCFGPLLLGGRWVRASLNALQCLDMIVLLQLLLNIPRHQNVDHSVLIIPVKGDATIQVTCPIFGECTCWFNGPNQMANVFLTDIFHPKILHHEREQYWLLLVIPKAWCLDMFVIPEWCQLALKALICKDTRLWQSPNCLSQFQVDKTRIRHCHQVVLFLYPTGEQGHYLGFHSRSVHGGSNKACNVSLCIAIRIVH